MANWTAKAPSNPDKANWLHDHHALPKAPKRGFEDWASWLWLVALTILFTAGFTAIAVQTRATWDTHRDWVVPVVVPMLALGGLGLAYLVVRVRIVAALPGLFLLAITLTLLVLNILRGVATEGDDGLRDAMSIVSSVFFGLSLLAFVVMAAWVEITSPTRAPGQEP